MTNQRTDTAHGSPVFWAEPFAAPRNLPTGWHWLGPEWVDSTSTMAWRLNERWPLDTHRHPQPLDLEPDDGDVSSPAAEAPRGRVSGADDVAAATGDEDDHGDSVPPVAADGTWAPGLVGAALRAWSERRSEASPCGVVFRHEHLADVFDRHGNRLRVVLRRPMRRGDLVWERDVVGYAAGRREG